MKDRNKGFPEQEIKSIMY
jgi:serine/threonine protein kinase